jgi:cell division protein FtsL
MSAKPRQLAIWRSLPRGRIVVASSTRSRWLAWGIVVYTLIAASGMGVAAQSQRVRDLFAELERTQQQQDELLSEYSRLLLERSTLASYQNVDQIAEQSLAMRFPELVERVAPGHGANAEGHTMRPTNEGGQ